MCMCFLNFFIGTLFIHGFHSIKAPSHSVIEVSVIFGWTGGVWLRYYEPCQSSWMEKSVVNLLSEVCSFIFWRVFFFFFSSKVIVCRCIMFECVSPCISHRLQCSSRPSLAPKRPVLLLVAAPYCVFIVFIACFFIVYSPCPLAPYVPLTFYT